MSESDQHWDRLVRKARTAGLDDEPVVMPFGFATRVLHSPSMRSQPESPAWESLATGGLLAACVVAVACVLFIGSVFNEASDGTELADLADPLVEVAFLE